MPWNVRLGDKSLSTGQIPINKLEEIAQAEGTSWINVMETNPAVSWKRFLLIVGAVAETLGVVNPTDLIHNGDEFLEAAFGEDESKRWISELPAKSDESFVNGNPTTPEAPDGGSSPGASGGTDGSPTKSDDSDQTTS